MNVPTEEHSINLGMMEQLGKNRPGRAYLRESMGLWKENLVLHVQSAAKLREMVEKAQGIIDAAKDKEPVVGSEENGNGE